jgi:hypothetical protein
VLSFHDRTNPTKLEIIPVNESIKSLAKGIRKLKCAHRTHSSDHIWFKPFAVRVAISMVASQNEFSKFNVGAGGHLWHTVESSDVLDAEVVCEQLPDSG